MAEPADPPAPSTLTRDEQVALVAGLDAWHTVPLPRVGLPSLRVTDGPTGARGPDTEGAGDEADTSACFPVGSALGATWDVDLLGEIPYTALQQMLDPLLDKGHRNYMKAGYLDELSDAAIDRIVEGHADRPAPAFTHLCLPEDPRRDRSSGAG